MMKIMLVDDHTLFRDGLANLLDAQPDIHVVGDVGTIKEAFEVLGRSQPDIILMDINLPDGNGLEAIGKILDRCPEADIVVLTVSEEEDSVLRAIFNGARGFLLKNTPFTKLLASLRGLEKGEPALTRTMTGLVLDELTRNKEIQPQEKEEKGLSSQKIETGLDESPFSSLTSREMEVLEELAKGLSNREISSRLVISENTVKIHVHHILKKLQVQNRKEAARLLKKHS